MSNKSNDSVHVGEYIKSFDLIFFLPSETCCPSDCPGVTYGSNIQQDRLKGTSLNKKDRECLISRFYERVCEFFGF